MASESSALLLVDTAGVQPEVAEVVTRGLLCAEAELAIASFSSASTVEYIRESDLVIVGSPSVRKNSVGWDTVAFTFDKAEFAVVFNLQETHDGGIVQKLKLRALCEKMFAEVTCNV
jgi:hypothetical protein